MNHIQQIEKEVVDAEMSMLSIFLKMKDNLGSDEELVFNAKADKAEDENEVNYDKLYHCYIRFDKIEKVNYESKNIVLDDEFELKSVQDKILQDYVDIFQSFLIDTQESGSICLVAHGKFISEFDLKSNKFKDKHLVLPSEIDLLFHIDKYDSPNDEKTLGVLLKNSDVYYNLREKFNSNEEVSFLKNEETRLKEWDSFEMENYKGTLYICDPSINKQNWLLVYNEDSISILDKQGIDILVDYHHPENNKKIVSLSKYYEFGASTEQQNHQFVINEEGKHNLYMLKDAKLLSQNDKYLILKRHLFTSESEEKNSDSKQNTYQKSNYIVHFHSYPNKYIALNHDTISVHDIKDSSNDNAFDGFMVASFQIINENVNYALCREIRGSDIYGLLVIDFHKILRDNSISFTRLNDNDVALDPQLSWFESLERIGFMNSVNEFVLLPYLHQDRIVLMGYQEILEKEENKILLESSQTEKYSIFCTNQTVYNWTLLNGKLLDSQKVDFPFNFKDFDIEKKVQNGVLLLKNCQDLIFDKETKLNDIIVQFLPPNQHQNLNNYMVSKIRLQVLGMRKWIAIKFNDNQQIEHQEFEFPLFQKSMMFLNQRFDRLLVILQDKAIIYNREEKYLENTAKIVWVPIRSIQDYPFHIDYISEKTSQPHVVSPDFSYYLKYDNARRIFTINQLSDGELVAEIDTRTLYAFDIGESKQEAFRFTWVQNEESMFKVMHSCGTEIVYKIDKESQEIRVHHYNVWPLFEEEFIQEMYNNTDEPFYAQLDSAFSQDDNQIQNLKLKYQLYKSDFYLKKYEGNSKIKMIYKKSYNDRYIQQSFTYLHWALVYSIKYEIINVEDLTDRALEGIIYNIFPGGKTFLHLLAFEPKSALQIFERCHDEETGIKYHIPYLPSFKNKSFFTNALQKDRKKLNHRTAISILQYLKYYGIDHHSRCMNEFYKDIISTKNQIVLDYLESRMIQTKELKELDYGSLNYKERVISAPKLHGQQYGDFMPDQQSDQKSIKVEILDIPAVYHYEDPNFQGIFEVLSKHDNQELFSNKSIQTLIDMNYNVARVSTIIKRIIPFVLFHILYVAYTNILYENRNDDDNEQYKKANIVVSIVLYLFSIGFFLLEIRKIWIQRFDYLYLFWNYVDLFAPCLVFIQISYYFAELSNGEEVNFTANRVFLSLATLLMWTKFLSVFRLLDATNYLIRTIIEVIYDMGIFLLVLLITVVGFGDSFLRLSLGNETENQFITNFPEGILYAYSMILGGYDTEAFGEVGVSLVQILWIACTIIDMIVMLNLLIAIISASFEKITKNQTAATYQEKARVISENRLLILDKYRMRYAEKNLYIVQGKDVEKENELCDEEEKRFNDLNELCQGIKKSTNQNIKAILDHQKERDSKQEEANSQFLKRIGEVKINLFMSTQDKLKNIDIMQHSQQVKRVILYELQLRYPDDFKFWRCEARQFIGCYSEDQKDAQARLRTAMDEIIYRCKTCCLDFCAECYKMYQYRHPHPLENITLGDLANQDFRYKEGWGCDGNEIFPHCKRAARKDNDDIYEEFYADENALTTFCFECITHFKRIEADFKARQELDEDEDDHKSGLVKNYQENDGDYEEGGEENEDQESSELK